MNPRHRQRSWFGRPPLRGEFLGYVFRKLDRELAPMLPGIVLGPMMEEFLRRVLLLSKGDLAVLATRPISATMLIASLVLLALVLMPTFSKTRKWHSRKIRTRTREGAR